MTKSDDKAEFYDLVRVLHERGWTAPTIGFVLDYSDQRVRDVLTDLGLHHPVRFTTLIEAVSSLDSTTADRILRWRRLGIPTSTTAETNSGA